jgi:hypothetical protein
MMPDLFSDPDLQAGFAVTVVFTPLSIIVTGLRFYATRLSKRRIGFEDWWAFGALICFLVWTVFISLSESHIDLVISQEN